MHRTVSACNWKEIGKEDLLKVSKQVGKVQKVQLFYSASEFRTNFKFNPKSDDQSLITVWSSTRRRQESDGFGLVSSGNEVSGSVEDRKKQI